MFISAQQRDGLIYIAQRSRKGYRKYLWTTIAPANLEETPIDPESVPELLRRQAHNLFRRGKLIVLNLPPWPWRIT